MAGNSRENDQESRLLTWIDFNPKWRSNNMDVQ